MENSVLSMAIARTLILLLLLFHCFAVTSAVNNEGKLLMKVKSSVLDPSGYLSSWSERDATPCNWTGITCKQSLVVEVNLSSANISGLNFPFSDICCLPYLSVLSLYNNSINSTLPETISLCRRLTVLNLANNFFDGSLPHTLANLQNLRTLDLDANGFSGEIPASFGRFRRLEDLILTSNLLNGSIPASLGSIRSLKTLELAYNPFNKGQLPPELGSLTKLESFWVSGCNLVGEIPATFSKLTRLINFDVSNNNLRGSIPSLIFQMKSIVQLEMYHNSFTGNLPAGWANLTRLRRVDLSMNNLSGPIPDELCELPLESLILYQNDFNGKLPESIAKSPNLIDLRIFSNHLQGQLPSDLGLNSPLKRLDVTGNHFSGPIPENLCYSGQLDQLILISNSFTGSIPEDLGNCRNLTRVRLCGNFLTGAVPAELWGLPHVSLLDLSGNRLSGNISHLIGGAKSLSTLDISRNNFSGSLPEELGMVEGLVELLADHNKFSGEIPSSLFQLGQLSNVHLESNELSGEIPMGISKLMQLNELNLSGNQISGAIPSEIGFLKQLTYLDLSLNHLSGEIPAGLENLKLNILNLSCNGLSGPIPEFFLKEVYQESFLQNRGLCGGFAGLCGMTEGRLGNNHLMLALRSSFVAVVLFLMVILVLITWNLNTFEEINTEEVPLEWKSFTQTSFNESEILDCISDDNLIGTGATGKVYKGELKDGHVVAVKKLTGSLSKDDEYCSSANSDHPHNVFSAEVGILGEIRHNNIIRLLCCCSSSNWKVLVFEYMQNGSLSDALHRPKGGIYLDWNTRFKIALDIAEGLSYLHHDCVPPIIHRDIKSDNILLDKCFAAKISDFGVAKMIEDSNHNQGCRSTVAGSFGYIAPEYAYTLRISEKSDIYSFGIVLLELVSGKHPTDPNMNGQDLVTWICTELYTKGFDSVIHPSLQGVHNRHIRKILNIALLCTHNMPLNRPSMHDIVLMMQDLVPGLNTADDQELVPGKEDREFESVIIKLNRDDATI